MTSKKLYCFIFLLWTTCLVSCHEKIENSNKDITLDSFAVMAHSSLQLDSHHIRSHIGLMIENDKDGMTADYRVRSYYRHHGKFLWIDRLGIDCRADTLLRYLKTVSDMGFSERKFRVGEIERDMNAIRNLDFDSTFYDINKVYGRLEYNLTKAYLRYTAGQRFGYMNPTYIFNRLDTLKQALPDSLPRPVRYRTLFDIDMEHADNAFYAMAIRKTCKDSLSSFLRDIQPKSPFYQALKRQLNQPNISQQMKAKLMCNMERARWRLKDYPQAYDKYVIVNIPSLHLTAIDHEDTLTMRIGCGSYETKTPLLTSQIMRMDLNPKWFVPRSIILRDILGHVGNKAYFDARNYYVYDKLAKKEVDLTQVTTNMLLNPNFAVVQRGGKGNSLGRIIFRFDNQFAVFLHDTSSKEVFSREDRSISHGCVRVEKPFELAQFMLQKKEKRLIEKVEYSMTADSLIDKSMMVGSIKVEPKVPLFITYFTLYPKGGGQMDDFADIYGYDRVIYYFLKNYAE